MNTHTFDECSVMWFCYVILSVPPFSSSSRRPTTIFNLLFSSLDAFSLSFSSEISYRILFLAARMFWMVRSFFSSTKETKITLQDKETHTACTRHRTKEINTTCSFQTDRHRCFKSCNIPTTQGGQNHLNSQSQFCDSPMISMKFDGHKKRFCWSKSI